MAFISDFARGKTRGFRPPSPSTFFDRDPQPDGGGDVGILGAGSWSDAERAARIALDHYGYALTPEEIAKIEEPRGRGFMETAFRVLEIPSAVATIGIGKGVSALLPGEQALETTNLLPSIGAAITLDDDRLLKEMPFLDTDGDNKAEVSTAALLKGGNILNPQGFGGKALLATSGLLADLAFDPLNWIGFGTLGVGKAAATQAAKSAVTRAGREAAEALIKGTADDLVDPYARRIIRKMSDETRGLRDEIFESAQTSKSLEFGRDLTNEEITELRKLVDGEVFRHELDQALLLDGVDATKAAVGPSTRELLGGDTAELIGERLTDSTSVLRGEYNRISQLVVDKQFRTLAQEFPEFVKSKATPAYATGGLSLTVPFGRQAAGGIKLGLRTDRAVTAPIRKAVGGLWDKLPDSNRIKNGVQSLWHRRGVEVAEQRVVSKGRAWDLAAAKGQAQRALRSLNAQDAPEQLRQSLVRIAAAADTAGDDIDEAYRIFGSVLDGETKVDDLLANPELFSKETAEAIAEAHEVSRAVLDTIHAALKSFDDDVGFIEDYFPLVASDAMVNILEGMAAHSRAVPLEAIEAAASTMADEAAAARLRVGGQILSEWLGAVQSAKQVAKGGTVVDHSRFMNSRLLGKTVFSVFGDPDLTLTNKRALAEYLGAEPAQIGWSSRTTINDAVRDALEFMEQRGLLKKPKEIDPFSMDVPAVLESYINATQRVLHFKTFVNAAEQMGLVKAAPEAIEVGLTLAQQTAKYQDDGMRELLRTYRKWLDDNRVKITHELEDVAVGNHTYKLPKGMLESPEVREAIGKAQAAMKHAQRQYALHREAGERTVRELVDAHGVPAEFAEDFAVLDSDKALKDLVSTLWSTHQERVAQLRSAAVEMGGRRAPENLAAAKRQLNQTADEWGRQLRQTIAEMRDQWADSFGFTRYKSEGSFDLTELHELPNGQLVHGGQWLGEKIAQAIRDEVVTRVGGRLSASQRRLLEQADSVDAMRTALDFLDESAQELELAGALKAWSELSNLVEVTGVTFDDLLATAGPADTIRIVEQLAGFATPPPVNDELYDIAADMARELNGFPYSPKVVRGPNHVGDTQALWAEYEAMDDVAPGTVEVFERLREQVQEQISFLEDRGFEFQLWHFDDAAPYEGVSDLVEALPSRQVFIETGKTEAAPPLRAPITLGSGLPVPFIDAFDTLHKILGHGIYGYGDDAAGVTNAWLAHLQMFDGDDVRQAYTSLTRARRIAELSGYSGPVKADMVDPRIASPWPHNTVGASLQGESVEGALEGGAGFTAGLPENVPDDELRELNRATNLKYGNVRRSDPFRGEEAAANARRIDQEIYDEERKFRVLLEQSNVNPARQAAWNADKKLRALRAVEAEMPVRVVEGNSVLVTLRNGQQKQFATIEDARAWWADQHRDWWAARERVERGGSIPGNPRSNRPLREITERSEGDSFLDEYDRETFNSIIPETFEEATEGVDPTAVDDLRGVRSLLEQDIEGSFVPKADPSTFPQTQKTQRLPDSGPRRRPDTASAEEGLIFARADESLAVFPGLDEARAEWNRLNEIAQRARAQLAEAYEEFSSRLSAAGLDLRELTSAPPPSLREARLGHPLFHDPSWQKLVEAAHVKQGAAKPTEAARAMVEGWRESTMELVDRRTIEGMTDTIDGTKVRGAGAGVVEAIASGDWRTVAEQETAVRALLDRAGLDSDRLLIEPLGNGEYSVRWGAEVERVVPDIREVRPALTRALQEAGVTDTATWSVRRLIAEVKARELKVPELGPLLDRATGKGNLPFEIEEFFYLHELLPKISIYRRAGVRDLADADLGSKMLEVLDELEPFVNTKGLRGNPEKLAEVWEANQSFLAKKLTAKDFQRLAALVEVAPLGRQATARLRMLTHSKVSRMATSATEALRTVDDLVNSIYQEVTPEVSKFFHDAIESSEYLAVRQADMLGSGRGTLFQHPSEGFDPHYSQTVTNPQEQELFERRITELNTAARSVASDLKELMRKRALASEKASFVDHAMKELADIVPAGDDIEGWIEGRIRELNNPLRPTRRQVGVTPGFTDQGQFGLASRELDGKLIDEHLGLVLESMAAHTAALWSPLGVRMLAESVRGFERYWKGATTVARPTFVPRNIMGGTMNGLIIDVGAREYSWVGEKALKVRRALADGDTWEQALKRLDPADADVFRQARQAGVFEAEFTSDLGLQNPALRRRNSIKPWSEDFFLFNLGGKFMQSSEDFMRMAAFYRWYRPGDPGSALFAKEMVNAAHFDYANLTQFETKLKKLVPFFVWTRRNIPLQARVMVERPGMINRYTSLVQNVEAAFNDPDGEGGSLPIPAWMGSQAVGLGTLLEHDDEAWTRLIFSPDMPVKDLEQFVDSWSGGNTKGPVLGALEWMSNSLTPLAKIPLDVFERKDYGDVPAPLGLQQAFQVMETFGFDIGTENVDTGDYEVPNWMRSMYEAFVPFQREWLETAGVFQGDDRRANRLGVHTEDGLSTEERIRAGVMSLARAAGVRGATKEDLRQDEINLEETVRGILDHAEAEGRILRDPEGDRLRRIDLARIAGDPFEGGGPEGERNEVRALDGDTIVMEDGERVRLAYLDTAELGEAGADEARRYLARAISRGEVEVEVTGYDEHGRTVGEVFVNGVNLSDALLGAGFGQFIPSVHKLTG